MAETNRDRIFQLSLTEIAFILVFLLMLLLGMLFFKTKQENIELKAKLDLSIKMNDDLRSLGSYQELSQRYEALKKNIESYLRAKSIPDSQKVFDDLVSVAKLDREIEDLKRQLEKVSSDFQMCKLQSEGSENPELKKILEDKIKIDEMLSKLKAKGVKINAPEQLIDQFLSNVKEVEKLRSQCGGGAIGACWLDENGQTQRLLDIVLEQDGISVSVANLPDKRLQELKLLPGIELATRPKIPYNEFSKSFGPLFQWSKERTPECRHYVGIKSNIPLTKDSTPRRHQVQQYFYGDESIK